MKASNAASASAFVSAIQISCRARLAFGCWLFGSLASTLAVLCTQQRCSRVVGQTSPAAFQKPSDCQFWPHIEPAPFQIEQQFAPILRTFARAVGEADEFFAALRRRADQHQDALLLVFKPRLQVDAICPDVHVAFRRQIALLPSLVLVEPTVLEADDRCRR